MSGELQDIFNNKSALQTYLSAFGVSILAAASRSILSENRRSISGFLRGLILAIFGSYIIGSALQDQVANHVITEGMYKSIVGITGFIADDLFILLLKLTKMVTDNPKIIFDIIMDKLDALRGKQRGE